METKPKTVKELREYLADKSDDMPVYISAPVQGDCENVDELTVFVDGASIVFI